MINIPKIDFQPYFEVAWRRKWWIAFPFLLVLFIGVAYLFVTPKMYRASTLILVEAQRVPEDYVKSTITESLQSRLSTITQQVNSRTNLVKIIEEFRLYQEPPNNSPEFIDKVTDYMAAVFKQESHGQDTLDNEKKSNNISQGLISSIRQKINVSIQGNSRDGRQSFEISFAWFDPQIAADVANAIASQFIEENLKVREEMAMGTTQFLDTEVDRIRRQLIEKEQELKDFKESHMGTLPEQLQSNLSMVNQLSEELKNLENRVASDRQQLIMLQNQIKSLRSYFQSMNQGRNQSSPAERGMTEYQSLVAQLKELENRYTDKHPDVVSLKKRIAALNSTDGVSEENSAPLSNLGSDNRQIAELQGQVTQLRNQIQNYEQQIKAVKQKLQMYNKRVEQTAQTEIELKDLQRSYTTVQQRYQDLLNRKLNAQMSEELEKRQKGEQFRVVDPAIAPESPFQPDRRKVGLMTVVLGLGLGCGLAYVRESLDPALYSAQEVESIFGIKVVVSIPQMEETDKDR